MKNSFYYDSTNSILKTHAEKIKFSGIDIFPGVTLNNMKMKGSLSGEFIFDDICNTLTNPPKACNQYTRIKIYDERSFEDWFVIISVILLGAALFSLLVHNF